MKRTPLKRKTALVAKTPLKRTQWKRTRQSESTELRNAKQAIKQRSGGRCEGLNIPHECSGQGQEAHHVKTRARGGSDSPANLMWICSALHHQVTVNPKWAKENGLMKHSWEEE